MDWGRISFWEALIWMEAEFWPRQKLRRRRFSPMTRPYSCKRASRIKPTCGADTHPMGNTDLIS